MSQLAIAPKQQHHYNNFPFADLPKGILGTKILTFVLGDGENFPKAAHHVRIILLSNKLWKQAAADWLANTLAEGTITSQKLKEARRACRFLREKEQPTRIDLIKRSSKQDIYFEINESEEALNIEGLEREVTQIEESNLNFCALRLLLDKQSIPAPLIERMIVRCPRLIDLGLRNCPEVKLSHLKQLPKHTLRGVNFYKNISLSEAEMIELIQSQSKLEDFTMRSISLVLTDAVMAALADSCSQSLRTLFIEGDARNITPQGWLYFFSKCQNLDDLLLRGAPGITAEVFSILPPSLRSFEVSGIPIPSKETLLHFAKVIGKHPRISVRINEAVMWSKMRFFSLLDQYASLYAEGKTVEAAALCNPPDFFPGVFDNVRRELTARNHLSAQEMREYTDYLINKNYQLMMTAPRPIPGIVL